MKIDIYSDMHIDSWLTRFKEHEIRIKPTKGCKLCLFAGDAGNGPLWYAKVMQLLRSKYNTKVIGVPGNHDYYKCKHYEGMIDLTNHDPSNRVYEFGGLKIVTSTLWSNFRNLEVSENIAENSISDFFAIPGMTGSLMKKLNKDAVEFLEQHHDADIVMTHFGCLENSVHPAYAASSKLNPYFINHLPELVEKISPKVWVHGHTHKKFDYMYKGVRVVANPSGYCMEEQQEPVFQPLTIEV